MPALISGTYTIVNPKTGGWRTVRVQDDDFSWMSYDRPPVGTRALKGLNGSDNESSFCFLGFLLPSGLVKFTRKSEQYPTLVAAAKWLVKNGAGREAELGKAYAVRSGKCCFCNRKLTTPGSVHFGYGPDCAEKNGMPWTSVVDAVAVADEIEAASAVREAQAIAAGEARVGWQTVRANPPIIDGRPRRTYRDLFGED